MKSIKIKTLGFKVVFNGKGCVNWYSSEQKWMLLKNQFISGKIDDNVKFAKKSFILNEMGEPSFLYKVSNECIRHTLWEEEMPFVNAAVVQLPYVQYNALARPCMLERGYMQANAINSFKKKSPVTITDAIENGVPRTNLHMDVHSTSGLRDSNSYFTVENVGEAEYISSGVIDLQEMQFISMDISYDRQAISDVIPANFKIYMDALKRNLPFFNEEPNYYYMSNSFMEDEWAEKGILLSAESVDWMIKDVLKRIINLSIKRKGAIFETKSLLISYIDEDGTLIEDVEITEDCIDNFFFEVDGKYNLASEDKIIANNKKYKEFQELVAKTKVDNKENKGKGKQKSNQKKEENA